MRSCPQLSVSTSAAAWRRQRPHLAAAELPDDLSALHGLLRDRIPAGVGKGHERSEGSVPPPLKALGLPPGSASELSERQRTTIAVQFGSLGSGNHFVEVCLDERDRVWIVLHSGSRGIGNQLATAHIQTARLLAQEEGQVLEDRDLAWLAEGRPEFDAYVADMLWAQRYAWGNREQMMDAALTALRAAVPHARRDRTDQLPPQLRREGDPPRRGGVDHPQGCHPGRTFGHGGHPGFDGCVVVHRAGQGQRGLVRVELARRRPATRSQGGVPPVDHRVAPNRYGGQGVGRNAWPTSWSTKHPDAYKPIAQVMADQADLVEVVHELHQVVNLKGT